MFEFHVDKKRYFEIQYTNSERYVIPFIEAAHIIKEGSRVLEIGCGEAGVLLPFLKRGCSVVGVELYAPRLETAREMLADYISKGKVLLVASDIYDVNVEKDLGGKFDIIILKDVIEHIHDQAKLMAEMKRFLNPGGVIFFGFPPWQMPFGGHQQIIQHKWLSKTPYFHLLPKPVYAWILKKFKADVRELLEIKETGISIERFERIVRDTGFEVVRDTHFLINPIYEYKFGWKAKKQWGLIKSIPWIRNFFTSCVYYLIKPIEQR